MKKPGYLWFFLLPAFLTGCKPDARQEPAIPQNNWTLEGFVKADSLNPILVPAPDLTFDCPVSGERVNWEERNVLNPAAVVRGDSVYLFYRAQDHTGTSRIGMAVSADGLHFVKRPKPVFYPANDSMKVYEWNYRKAEGPLIPGESYFDGTEDPRIVEREDGTYIMTYTAYDGKTARLCLASSTDLQTWTKHGPVLTDSKYRDTWSKSGAVVARQEGGRAIAVKIAGKYRMYFGDTDLFMAASEDLIRWSPAENEESGKLIEVLHSRAGYFDSRLVEPGPYALQTEHGILLIYNGSNAANFNDPGLPKFTYAAGQALFDGSRPWKLLDRTAGYFIHPDKDYEKVGEVNEVCFVEGLVHFKGSWILYYGTADSRIAAAVSTD